jgi:hypothetical protein
MHSRLRALDVIGVTSVHQEVPIIWRTPPRIRTGPSALHHGSIMARGTRNPSECALSETQSLEACEPFEAAAKARVAG